MKAICKQALLVSVFLLALTGIVQAQLIIAPVTTEVQVPVDILVGLMGKYMVMAQEYQNLIAQGGSPDSATEFRLAASISMYSAADSELASVLSGLSRMAFWINVNLFSVNPSFKVDLTGSLGNIELLSTATESIVVSREDGIYATVPMGTETSGLGGLTSLVFPINESILPEGSELLNLISLLSLEDMQEQLNALLEAYLSSSDMQYDGLEQTPKGIAHVVRLISVETGAVTTLWILDETWDLCKVEIEDPYYDISATVIVEGIELVAADTPESTFDLDTTDLAMVSYEEFVLVVDLKLLAVGLTGVPVAADLSTSLPVISQGEQVIISSNGLDSEDAESDLTVNIEYKSTDGEWTPLTGATYIGVSPSGRWEVVFAPSLSDPLDSYDFRVTYTDSLGFVSDPLEILDALTVIAIPPEVLSVSPIDRGRNVAVSSSLIINFSQVMDMASTEAAFSLIDPSGQVVTGSFEWADTTLIFKPDQDLLYNTLYSAKILASAMGLSSVMGSDFVWSFTTESAPLPTVTAIAPADKQLGVAVSTQVSVVFSEAMNKASVESFFSLKASDGQVVSGSFLWDDKTLTFIPAQNLYYNTTYQVLILGSAESALGARLDTDEDGSAEGSPEDNISFWFSTEKFPVFAVNPASESAQAGDYITIDIVAQAMSGLKSFSLSIDFDPAVLKVLTVERLSFALWRPRPKFIEDVDMWQPTVIDNDQGIIILAADSTRSGGVSGTGGIATITFQAVSAGESALSLQNVVAANALGEDIATGLREGSVHVIGVEPWDINQDGVVDIRDFIMIQSSRGANADVNGDGVVDILDLVAAFGGAQTSPALEPLTNVLANNFPNPFNPETWIPYELSGDAHVVIRIYSVTGQLVRSLDLGYRLPGRYLTKATAAHWDGTNEIGERVASGIYYYSIKAGNFSAVKKMVVAE